MLHIGAHMSIAKGYFSMGKDAVRIGADTLQFFVRNPRGAKIKELHADDMEKFRLLLKENAFAPILAHAPYTMNACSRDIQVRHLAKEMMKGDLERMELLPGNFYNFHPGSHVGQGAETAIKQIAELLNETLFPKMQSMVLLETMSGKGSEVGRSFEELASILALVECRDKVGICMDACHLWDGGYDIAGDLGQVLHEFDVILGLEKLRAFHLNDSMNAKNSHKDRHARIGQGKIGMEAMVNILTHPKLRELPFILETPADLNGHADEIRLLKEACGR